MHRATLQVGRGLVGLIAAEARPLNLPDAQSHPAFAYLPETGEEVYHSFLGVPVLRAGRTLGVLVVQNRSYRNYVEEEIEALQTTAMVLAEMFASGEMEDLTIPGADLDVNRPVHLKGVGVRGRNRARPCRAARAARRRHPAHRRGRGARASPARRGDGEPPALRRRSPGARRRGRGPASTARSSKPTRCSPRTAAGRGGCRRRSATASPPRRRWSACRTTRARRWRGRPIRSCATGCTISTISPTGSCAS